MGLPREHSGRLRTVLNPWLSGPLYLRGPPAAQRVAAAEELWRAPTTEQEEEAAVIVGRRVRVDGYGAAVVLSFAKSKIGATVHARHPPRRRRGGQDQAGAQGQRQDYVALDVKVILTPPCIFH
jgi:hypothetical protein